MGERDMEQEGQNRKRKRWEIERKMFFYLFFGIVIFMFR
jgi:hypothetical protein